MNLKLSDFFPATFKFLNSFPSFSSKDFLGVTSKFQSFFYFLFSIFSFIILILRNVFYFSRKFLRSISKNVWGLLCKLFDLKLINLNIFSRKFQRLIWNFPANVQLFKLNFQILRLIKKIPELFRNYLF